MARSVRKSASSAELENANTARPCATGAFTVNARFIDRRNCRSCGFTPPFSLRFQATRSLILASLQQIVCADFCTDPHRCGLGSSLRHHAEFQPLHGPSERSTLHTIVNSTETLFDRTFGRMGFLLLRPALWPLIVFVTLQMGATYAISTLLRFEGRFAFIRALTAAAGMSLLMTAFILTALWSMLTGMISH
jgi:hypothetical protein